MTNNFLQTLFRISIVVGIFIYILNNYSILIEFDNLDYPQFLLTVFLKSLNVFIVGYLNYFAFKIVITHISYIHILRLHITSLFGNFFSFAKSGTVFKAAELKSTYNLRLKDFSLFFVVSQLFPVLIISILTFFYMNGRSIDKGLSNIFLIIAIGILVIILLLKIYISKSYVNEDKNFMLELFNTRNILMILLIQLSTVIVNLSYNWTLSNSLGYELTIFDNLIYTAVSVLSIFVSLTPNALGIKEFFIINLGSVTNFPPEYLFNLSVAERFADALMLLIIFLITKFSGNNLSYKNNENNY